LVDDAVFAANEERLRKDTIDHHDETFDCEEARVVLFIQVIEIMVLFNVLLKFHLHFVNVFLLLVELFIPHLILQLDIFELFVYLFLFLDIIN
jgi:hypothetical protein